MTSRLAWCSLAPVRTHATGSRVRSDDIDSGQRAAERRATGWQVCGRGAIATRSRGARTQSQQCRRRWNNQPSQQMKQTNTTKNVRKRRTLAALNRVRSRNLIYPHVRRRRRRERAKPVHHTHTHTCTAHMRSTQSSRIHANALRSSVSMSPSAISWNHNNTMWVESHVCDCCCPHAKSKESDHTHTHTSSEPKRHTNENELLHHLCVCWCASERTRVIA